MRSLLLQSFIVFFLLVSCKETPQPKVRQTSPRNLFPGLFDTVQLANIFPDSKTFPDCVPLKSPQEIMDSYQTQKLSADFNLKRFVLENFRLPSSASKNFKTANTANVEEHIKKLWNVLKRNPAEAPAHSSLIKLPNAYVVPGGRFREIYYWDSYFTMLGLAESGRHDLIESMVNNFASLIRAHGFIPNGNRTYYLTRSQPPFFSLMVRLLMDVRKEKADSILKANRDALELEYKFWMDDNGIKKGAVGHVVHLPDGSVLNRYCDRGDWPREEAFKEDVATARDSRRPVTKVYRDLRSGAESGWDFSSRWLADGKNLSTIQTTDIIPVDLNCLLYHLEQTLALAYNRKKDKLKKSEMEELAEQRKIALERFCWDRSIGYFRDYNWKTRHQSPYLSLAGMYPLYFKMVKQNRANAIAVQLQHTFLKPGGLITTPLYTGEQWDAPNGWAPLQWLAVVGLNNYGNKKLAVEISRRWVSLNIRVFQKSGKLMEKYNVVDTTQVAGGGEYATQDGFGWTNGVLLSLLRTELNQ
ncbi:alpha,alpha-trehalase TreF [Desertivirga brevis]|uniref:alpha,alpha-trehalase TreF n=1 Tax=Desertivirga brevis TaxID=2810310 RepID=UPI001A9772B1|nr:alpha,alpha-trehalase TreF [Pedobacter sp. SYSU D00873]